MKQHYKVKTIEHRFVMFLIEHRALTSFYRQEYVDISIRGNEINKINWFESEEGWYYWSKLYSLWAEELRKHKL